ncbi:MAG: hypothetical protein Fur0042_16950 [Cyanophyceae cyanobacterium]
MVTWNGFGDLGRRSRRLGALAGAIAGAMVLGLGPVEGTGGRLMGTEIVAIQGAIAAPAAPLTPAQTPATRLDEPLQTLNWLLVVAGLCPLGAVTVLWILRQRAIAQVVAVAQQRLGGVDALQRRIEAGEATVDLALTTLRQDFATKQTDGAALMAALEGHLQTLRAAAEADLDRFRQGLDRDRAASRDQLADLEREFISNMQILAGYAERDKQAMLQDYATRLPEELVHALTPHLRLEIQTLMAQLLPQGTERRDGAATVEAGEALMRAGRYADALAVYEAVLAQEPNSYEAVLGKGVALDGLQRYEGAIAAYDRAVTLKPDGYEGWFNRGLVLSRLGKDSDAITSFHQAIQLCPANGLLWFQGGLVLTKLERFDEALHAYQQAIALTPDNADIWFNQGNVLMRLNRPEDALAAYDRAADLNSRQGGLWHNRGIVLAQLGRYDDALAAYDRALELNPHNPESLYSRGNVLARMGRLAEAIASYDQLLNLCPDHDRGRHNRQQVAAIATAPLPQQEIA